QSGPNTGAGHGGGHNFMAEAANHYVLECLQLLINRGGNTIEVTQEAFDEFNQEIDQAMANSVWGYDRRARTYYRDKRGKAVVPMPWTHNEFWNRTRTPIEEHFSIR